MTMGPDDIKVRRLHRQHCSVVIVVPPEILEELEAGPGCYLAFELRRGSRRVEIYNISPGVRGDVKIMQKQGKKHVSRQIRTEN